MAANLNDTRDKDYATRLLDLQQVWWKRLFNVQAPYRWNLNRLEPGYTLEVECGIGRNLSNLRGHGIGVDHNKFAVEIACQRGYSAFTPSEFLKSDHARVGSFDSLLLSHDLEHLSPTEAFELLTSYVPFVKPGGLLIIETPQEKGYQSYASHVQFLDFDSIEVAVGTLRI